eukprot:6376649-Amphidinium_carterae.1
MDDGMTALGRDWVGPPIAWGAPAAAAAQALRAMSQRACSSSRTHDWCWPLTESLQLPFLCLLYTSDAADDTPC